MVLSEFPSPETIASVALSDRTVVALLDQLAPIVGLGLWDWHIERRSVWWSHGIYTIYGRDPALGPSFSLQLEYILEEDRGGVLESVARALAGDRFETQFRIRRERDGAVRTVHAIGMTQYAPSGAPARFSGVLLDITGRVHAAETARLRARALDAVGQAVVVTDRDGLIEYANDAVTRIFGWRPEELVGQRIEDHVRLPPRPPSADELASTPEAGAPWEGELALRRKDGGEFAAIVSSWPLVDDAGALSGVISVTTDVSALKRVERELRESELRFRSLFEESGLTAALYDVDGTLLMINARAVESLGVPRERAVGRNLRELAPETAARLLPRFEEVLARGASQAYEDTRETPTGRAVFVTIIAPVRVGARTLMQCVVREISDLRRAELALRASELRRVEALRRSEAEYRAMFENAPAMVHSIGRDGRIELVSDHWLETLGYAREEVLGRRSTDFLTPASRERAEREFIPAFFRTGTLRSAPYQMVSKRGGLLDVLLSASALRDEDGEVLRSYAVITDITEQRRLEQERRRLESQMQAVQRLESLGLLAGGVAHDFNNLLSVILGNVNALESELPDRSPLRARTRQIHEAATRAAQLANEMLAYSGKGAFVVERVDLSHEVTAIANLLRTSIAKTTELRFELADERLPVCADVAQLHQVVMNLVLNASEALEGRPGLVTLRTRARVGAPPSRPAWNAAPLPGGRYVILEVSDTGCGMSRETAERIFDPFFTTKSRGRGLGLAALQGIVRGHGGVVTIASEVGLGTTFTVFLPSAAPDERRDEPPAPAPASASASVSPPPHPEGRLILVVDDEPGLRTICAALLRRLGYRVVTAADGHEALELVERRGDELALVVLDLTMPRLSGEATFRAIRARHPELRILVSSGFADDSFVRALGERFTDFLRKPYEMEHLAGAVARLLSVDAADERAR